MSARILVVDDNPLNVKLLAAKLAKDYYVVSTAENGVAALRLMAEDPPDIVLLDVMMPEMDGFETCKQMKADPATKHIPVVMVTALSDTTDRVKGLEAGADDFLTKPINDTALMARVRSLLRLKMVMDEWRLREATAAEFAPRAETDERPLAGTRCLLLEDNAKDSGNIANILRAAAFVVQPITTVAEALSVARSGNIDMALVSLDLQGEDGLQVCAQLRAHEATRTLPILLIANDEEISKVALGLDLGASDYILRPVESSELIARTRTQMRQKYHYDRLRSNYEQRLALALVDPLTGAFNRRYLEAHMPKMLARYRTSRKPVSVLSLDIDFFKRVNDNHGHAAGDSVLKEFVSRMAMNLRPLDLVVRLGGEEFAVIMPEIDLRTALAVGERLREAVAEKPFALASHSAGLAITTSIGVASVRTDGDDTLDAVLERADAALYSAKESGRNKVVSATTKAENA